MPETKQPSVVEDDPVLTALLEAKGDYVSGAQLGEKLGISRPAILGRVNRLRDEGFAIEATRNRGYRLKSGPSDLTPSMINYELKRRGRALPLICFDEIDSTNSEAERQAAEGRTGTFAVLARRQTKGRGRLGREWHSESPDNLYLSVLFQPDMPLQEIQHFTLWAGIHICRALLPFVGQAPLRVKWPNDLHCNGLKFAGMLTEGRIDADRLRTIIFGIGLNVNGDPADFPRDLRKTATSLRAISGSPQPANEVAAAVLSAIHEAFASSVTSPTEAPLAEAWAPLDALAGKAVEARTGDTVIAGTAKGIDESGALRILGNDGAVHSVRAGDVTLRKS